MKDKNYMIISIYAEKNIWQNITSFQGKNPQQIGCRRNIPQHNEGHIKQTDANIILNNERLKAFPLRSGKIQVAYSHHCYSP